MTEEMEWVVEAAEQECVVSGPVPWPAYFPLYQAPWHERLRHWLGHHISGLLRRLDMFDPYDAWL